MSASWPGSMRGPRVKTPHLLLLLLLSSLTGTVLCQNDGEEDAEAGTEEEVTADSESEGGDDSPVAVSVEPDATPAVDPTPAVEISTTENEPGSGQPTGGTEDYPSSTDMGTAIEDEGLNPTIILIPVVLVVVIIGMIVCGIFINRRWNKKARIQELRKEDPYLDGSSTEKVPMPMFEEDVPSVLELEMEELDQWMKKDGGPAEESKYA